MIIFMNITSTKYEWQFLQHGKMEMVDISCSDDLSLMLVVEEKKT